MKPTIYKEDVLLREVAMGNQRAFARLFELYYKKLSNFVFRLTESTPVTEEIVQDAFLKVWIHRDRLPLINDFGNYLFILSKNQALNYLRKKANEKVRIIEWIDQLESESMLPDAGDINEEVREIIDEAVAKLPERQQRVYVLGKYERLKYEEIASVLDISPQTVKKHMQYAIKSVTGFVKSRINWVFIFYYFVFFK